jgi:ABC-2 type transport system permease protein
VSKTGAVLKHEFKQTLKQKSFIITTVGLPLLLLLGYLVYQGVQDWYDPGPGEETRIGYVDQAGGFDEYTLQNNAVFVPYEQQSDAESALLTGEIEEYILIPEDYVSGGRVTRYITKNELKMTGATYRSIERFLLSNLLAGELDPRLAERAITPMSLSTIQLDESGTEATGPDELSKVLLPLVFAMLFIFSIFIASGSLLNSVTEEKENRVIEIILSSVSAKQLLAGKIIGMGATGLIQLVVWMVSIKVLADVASVNIPLFSDISVPISMVLLGIAYFVVGYLFFASLMACAGSISSGARESQNLSVLIMMPAMIPLWLNPLLIPNPESTLARVLTFFPATSGMTSMMRLSRDAMDPWEIAVSLGILAGAVVVMMWVAAKVFRVFLLMYGKRPSLREIARYARES